MTLEEAIKNAIDGKAILFTGAGFSFGARNREGKSIAAGRDLANALMREIGETRINLSLDRASSAYLRRRSKTDLIKHLISQYSDAESSESHKTIASLPWERVYTTNYDTVFEDGRRKTQLPSNSVAPQDLPKDHLHKKHLVVHINGLISNLSIDSLDSSFKLASESYAADEFEKSGWAFHFRQDIRIAASIIFIGYSLYDLDIKRILHGEQLQHKCVFISAPRNDDNKYDLEDLETYGQVYPIGVDNFAHKITEIKADYLPQNNEIHLHTWQKIETLPPSEKTPSDAEVISLLTRGEESPNLKLESIGPNANKFSIKRSQTEELIVDGELRLSFAIIHGVLGAGKSHIAERVCLLASTHNKDAYILNSSAQKKMSELRLICEDSRPKLLIIENYHRHLDIVRWVADQRPINTTVILIDRTNLHDLVFEEVEKIVGHSVQSIDCTTLTDREILNACELLEIYGLWGKRSSWSIERKNQFVRSECNRQLPHLLVDVLRSQHLADRYRELLDKDIAKLYVKPTLICAFSLEATNFTPRIDLIQELLGTSIDWIKLRRTDAVNELVDLSSNQVKVKSSVLATFLLQEIFSSTDIVDTLTTMLKNADNAARHSQEYKDILYSLMRFSNLTSFLPENQRRAAIINFYENTKNLTHMRRNPQFWLQYGIACLTLGALDRAETYFSNAYSHAEKIEGYNTYQIDNHFARLQLEKSLQSRTLMDALVLFDSAKKIVVDQMRREKRHFPYRVALKFISFHERWKSDLQTNHKDYLRSIFSEVVNHATKAPESLSRNRYVMECLRDFPKAIEFLSQ